MEFIPVLNYQNRTPPSSAVVRSYLLLDQSLPQSHPLFIAKVMLSKTVPLNLVILPSIYLTAPVDPPLGFSDLHGLPRPGVC